MWFSFGIIFVFILPLMVFYFKYHLEEDFAEVNKALAASVISFVNSFWKSKDWYKYIDELKICEQEELGSKETLEPEEGTESFRD